MRSIPQVLLAVVVMAIAILAAACAPGADEPATVAGAVEFLARAESQLEEIGTETAQAQWVQANFITEDSEAIAARANERLTAIATELAKEATRFDGLELPADAARKMVALKLALTLPAPSDADLRRELSEIAAGLESEFGRGRYCPEGGECQDLGELSRTLASSHDLGELEEAWEGWRTISAPMRPEFQRFVELGNQGARELGFSDLGAMWRSKYDMEPAAFSTELDRLWGQVKPLYDSLHCYVRAKLEQQYGSDAVSSGGPIPAHLLGNMWAQSWGNVYPLVAPAGGDPGFDLTEILRQRGVDEREMVRYGERFFTSLGFAPLPDTFWERSLFKQPRDRDVVCHASAWSIDWKDDLRIKMCIQINEEDFSTIHHELGHNFYQRAYKGQPVLFRDSANDGFHEGIGDTIALSVTPEYLVDIGLLDAAPDASGDLGVLMKMALDKIAFLPFGLLVDQWRWKVFSGEITPADYNAGWWELRRKYQGVAPPVERTEEDFDPGAKYHVPANVPYTRYFLAHILQFQFQRGLCEAAGYEGPLHRCSIYRNAAAGERLNRMLEMGSSQPWPDALEEVTGQREMDATAILDYFAPLQEWLDEQNEGQSCGWS